MCVLKEIDWLERAGEPVPEDVGVESVRSWDDALSIFSDPSCEHYNANGHLVAAHDRVSQVCRAKLRYAWWQRAREEIKGHVALYAPPGLPVETRDLLFEYLYEFVSMLLAEIIATPEAGCTYFREQLQWFYAGHLPCGWEGNWPEGRMRVF